MSNNDIKKFEKYDELKFGTLDHSLSTYLKLELPTINVNNFKTRIASIMKTLNSSITTITNGATERIDNLNKLKEPFVKTKKKYTAILKELQDYFKQVYVAFDKESGTEYTEKTKPVLIQEMIVKVVDKSKVDFDLLIVDEAEVKRRFKKDPYTEIPGIEIEYIVSKIEKPIYEKAEKILNQKSQKLINQMGEYNDPERYCKDPEDDINDDPYDMKGYQEDNNE